MASARETERGSAHCVLRAGRAIYTYRACRWILFVIRWRRWRRQRRRRQRIGYGVARYGHSSIYASPRTMVIIGPTCGGPLAPVSPGYFCFSRARREPARRGAARVFIRDNNGKLLIYARILPVNIFFLYLATCVFPLYLMNIERYWGLKRLKLINSVWQVL